MPQIPEGAQRLLKPFELGAQIAQGRRKAKISQEKFASRLGVSRKTLSDLERGAAEHVSLKTAMAALNLAGYVLFAAARRPPTMTEIMAQRAADRTRADELLQGSAAAPAAKTERRKGRS